MKTTKKLSPSVPISMAVVRRDRGAQDPSVAKSASPQREPSRLSNDVDPSMSLNSNVSVPVGNGLMATVCP